MKSYETEEVEALGFLWLTPQPPPPPPPPHSQVLKIGLKILASLWKNNRKVALLCCPLRMGTTR